MKSSLNECDNSFLSKKKKSRENYLACFLFNRITRTDIKPDIPIVTPIPEATESVVVEESSFDVVEVVESGGEIETFCDIRK